MTKIKENFKQEFLAWFQGTKLSQNKLAQKVGVNAGAFSDWKNGKYTGDNAALEQKLHAYYRTQVTSVLERGAFTKTDFDFVETTIYSQINKVVAQCQAWRCIGSISGNTGLGKTTALKRIKADNPNTIILKTYLNIKPRAVLIRLSEALGLEPKAQIDGLIRQITEKLIGSEKLILVDEAEHLKVDSVDLLRTFVDNDDIHITLILVGMPILVNQLESNYKYAYVNNRIGAKAKLPANIEEKDIELMVGTVLPNSGISGQVWLKLSKGVGRNLKNLVFRTIQMMRLNNVEVGNTQLEALVLQAAKSLGLA